jgi:c-di-GMP-related signal transduction protein
MNQVLTEAVEHLPLEPEVRGTLLNTDARNATMTSICELVKHYELGDWENVHAESRLLGIPQERLPELYAEAVQWAESVSGA